MKSKNTTFDKKFWSFAIPFGFLIAMTCSLPYLLTQYSLVNYDLSKYSGLGDAINGLMSPFVAMIAAILMFIAFWVQYKANEQQMQKLEEQTKRSTAQFDFNSFYEIFKGFKNEFDSWNYKSPQSSIEGSGKDGLSVFDNDLQNYQRIHVDHHRKTVDEINYFTEILLSVALSVRNSESLDLESKSLLVVLIVTFYSKKMEKELNNLKINLGQIGEDLSVTLLQQNMNLLHEEIVGARNDIMDKRMKQTWTN